MLRAIRNLLSKRERATLERERAAVIRAVHAVAHRPGATTAAQMDELNLLNTRVASIDQRIDQLRNRT